MGLSNLQGLIGAYGNLQQANAQKRAREQAKRQALTQGVLAVAGAGLGFLAGGPAGAAAGGKGAAALAGGAGAAGGGADIASFLPDGAAAAEGALAGPVAQAAAPAVQQGLGAAASGGFSNPLSGLSKLQAAGTLSQLFPAIARGDAGAATGSILGGAQMSEANTVKAAQAEAMQGLTGLINAGGSRQALAGGLANMGPQFAGSAVQTALGGQGQGETFTTLTAEESLAAGAPQGSLLQRNDNTQQLSAVVTGKGPTTAKPDFVDLYASDGRLLEGSITRDQAIALNEAMPPGATPNIIVDAGKDLPSHLRPKNDGGDGSGGLGKTEFSRPRIVGGKNVGVDRVFRVPRRNADGTVEKGVTDEFVVDAEDLKSNADGSDSLGKIAAGLARRFLAGTKLTPAEISVMKLYSDSRNPTAQFTGDILNTRTPGLTAPLQEDAPALISDPAKLDAPSKASLSQAREAWSAADTEAKKETIREMLRKMGIDPALIEG